MLLCNGVRKGNGEAIMTGVSKFSSLFYVRRHPQYQRIMAVHKYILGLMPKSIKEKVLSSLSLSRNNNIGHYQGGEAMLEEINKEAKSWISPLGVPTNKDWLKVFRNSDKFNQVNKTTKKK